LPLVVEADRRAEPAAPYPFPRVERWAVGAAHAIAAGTAQVRAALRAEGVLGRRIAVIPPAADLPALPAPDRRPPGLEGAPLLAFAGELAPAGGIELLLAALALVRRRHPAMRLVIAGDGEAQRLEGQLTRQPSGGHVVFTGPLSHRRAADVLPRADIAVFPALATSPMLQPSRHLLNAMAQGCAIVASDLDCHRELLVHGHSAVLFQAGSHKALASAILGLFAEPWRLKPLGAAARDYVGTRRSWEATAARYRRLYETVLADGLTKR
jgi:glycogen(starch) synthase